jgi:hypothetical protein
VAQLVNDTAGRLEAKVTVQPEEVLVNADYCSAGYGVLTGVERQAISLFARYEGLLLDPVYTARAAGGMLDLIRKGWVISIGMDIYRFSTAGLDVKMQLGEAQLKAGVTRTAAVKRAEVFERPDYEAPELGKTCNRPGDYDAFQLPSLMYGQPVFRRDSQRGTA